MRGVTVLSLENPFVNIVFENKFVCRMMDLESDGTAYLRICCLILHYSIYYHHDFTNLEIEGTGCYGFCTLQVIDFLVATLDNG